MAIVNGLKINWSDKSYSFVQTKEQADELANHMNYTIFTMTPCRAVVGRKVKYGFAKWRILDENIYHDIRSCFAGCVDINIRAEVNYNGRAVNSPYRIWENTIEAGKSYMVGKEWSTESFLKTYTSAMSDWQVLAAEYIWQHPEAVIEIRTGDKRRFTWVVYMDGDHLDFSLPYHGEGGEKDYVSKKGSHSKVLVNVD